VYYTDTFGACRSGCSRTHKGNDIMSSGRYKGRPVVAAHSGTVDWMSSSCCAISIDADDGIWSSWYIHLNNDEPFTDNGRGEGLAPGIVRGARVEEGQLIGWVGDSGNAEGVGPHLHFELRKYGTAISPYASLQAAKKTLVPRIAGATRYDTAVEISKTAFSDGADVAFVATGNNFPDALAGGPASVPAGGPVLLVTPTTVPGATAAELERLDVQRIYVLGGEAVVGPGVEAALGAYASEVVRIAGPNRYATAAAISETFFPSGADVVYLTSGTAFPDAVAGAPAAAKEGAPLLLIQQSGIPADTARELERLRPSEIVILGASGVVAPEVDDAAALFAPTVTRLAGSSRYSTAAAIAGRSHPSGATYAYLAKGAGFVDALAGISVARMDDAPILLVSDTLTSPTSEAIESLGVEHPVILGGPLAVPTTVDSELWSMFNDNDMPLWNNA
jgi:putative cell wall-binding protein